MNLTLSVSLLLLFSACTPSVPRLSPATRSVSHTQTPKGRSAPLLKWLKTDKKLNGKSAFYSLDNPSDALAARLFLIDHAMTSLDVQYYIYTDDRIGRIVSVHLIKAAKRGVKVRILLDDINTAGEDDKFTQLARHANIQLRLFNPNILRSTFRNLALLFNVNRLGKRMHNKMLVADGTVAIIGGRNIGEEYYATDIDTMFLDYDALVIGDVIPALYRSFDTYWNSPESIPSREVLEQSDKISPYAEAESYLYDELKKFKQSKLGYTVIHSDFNRQISQHTLLMTVADKATLYVDPPSKVSRDEKDNSEHIAQQITSNVVRIHHRMIVISPYFIPSDALMNEFKKLRKKNIEVIVITNSLSSTDVFPVYGGYQDSIKPLVQMGVKLYELKGDSLKKTIKRRKLMKKIKNPPSLSLHTKMIILDDDELDIGSANIDPRSNKLNTELVMLIESKKLATEQRKMINKVLSLENFYQLSWGSQPGIEVDGPIWTTLENGQERTYYAPPKTSWWKKIGADFISILPVKGYL